MQAAVSAPSPNWELVQSLYLKGLGPSQIEKQTGVKANAVSVRASRYGWRKHLASASVIVTQHNSANSEEKPDSELSKQSEAVRNALGRDLKRVCDLLETKIPKSIPDALKRQQAIEPLVRNAKTVFGWSEGQSQPAVRISILGSAVIDQAPVQEQGKVIDVTPAPQLPELT